MKGYTRDDWGALIQEEKEALQAACRTLRGNDLEGNAGDEELESAFDLLAPCEGCVPEGYDDADLILNIRKKFAGVYSTAAELAGDELEKRGLKQFHNFDFRVVIDPDYEDTTSVVVVDAAEGKPYCYLHTYDKAWHFHFEGLKELAEGILKAKAEILCLYDVLNRRT